ncbi:MAG: hypothetical protein LC798_13560 [Chloroflexi bacterium]|nr:hypothetical protein [Chloroflexota bacterium]
MAKSSRGMIFMDRAEFRRVADLRGRPAPEPEPAVGPSRILAPPRIAIARPR